MKNKIEIARELVKSTVFDPLKDSGVYFWVAGGVISDTISGQEYRDVDLYFRSMEDSQRMSQFCLDCDSLPFYPSGSNCHNRQFLSPEMKTWEFWTYPNKEDLTAEECISYFDFTVCSCAIDSNLDFYYNENFFDDLENKRLVYTGNHYHLANGEYHSCIKRLKRYVDKGYTLENFNFWLDSNARRRDFVLGLKEWSPIIETELNILIDRADENNIKS